MVNPSLCAAANSSPNATAAACRIRWGPPDDISPGRTTRSGGSQSEGSQCCLSTGARTSPQVTANVPSGWGVPSRLGGGVAEGVGLAVAEAVGLVVAEAVTVGEAAVVEVAEGGGEDGAGPPSLQ